MQPLYKTQRMLRLHSSIINLLLRAHVIRGLHDYYAKFATWWDEPPLFLPFAVKIILMGVLVPACPSVPHTWKDGGG